MKYCFPFFFLHSVDNGLDGVDSTSQFQSDHVIQAWSIMTLDAFCHGNNFKDHMIKEKESTFNQCVTFVRTAKRE